MYSPVPSRYSGFFPSVLRGINDIIAAYLSPFRWVTQVGMYVFEFLYVIDRDFSGINARFTCPDKINLSSERFQAKSQVLL